MGAIFSFLIPIGLDARRSYPNEYENSLEDFFKFCVPLVLIYTLLAELAPNAVVFEQVDDDRTVTTYAMDLWPQYLGVQLAFLSGLEWGEWLLIYH